MERDIPKYRKKRNNKKPWVVETRLIVPEDTPKTDYFKWMVKWRKVGRYTTEQRANQAKDDLQRSYNNSFYIRRSVDGGEYWAFRINKE